MNVSAKLAPLSLAIAALAAAVTAMPAAAQDSGPTTLIPRQQPAGDAAALAGDAPAGPVIIMDTLQAPGVDRIGLAGTGDGGFSTNLWQGSDPALVKQILPMLPTNVTSRATRRLARRFLQSPQLPPVKVEAAAFAGGAVASDATQPSGAAAVDDSIWLFETRLTRLAALGAWSDALALIELVPIDRMTDALVKLRADAYLVDGRTDAACAETQAALAVSPDVHWQKLQVFCQMLADQANLAELALSLLHEQGVDDPAFYWAAELMRGNRPLTPNGLGRLSPLNLAMLRHAGGPFPSALVRAGDPTLLRVMARMPLLVEAEEGEEVTEEEKQKRRHAAENAHIVIAERAVAAGSLDVEELRVLYKNIDFAQDPEPPQLSQLSSDNARARVYMFQLASQQTVPTAQAEVIARAIDLARADRGRNGPGLVTVAQVYAPMLNAMPPSPELIWFAGTAARALLASGDDDRAREWLDMARSLALTSIEAAGITDSLWPLDHLLTPFSQGRPPAQTMLAWQAALTGTETAKRDMKEMLLNLLVATGDMVTAEDWLPTLSGRAFTDARQPAPHLWHGLALAARDGRLGEAVAISLIVLGNGDLAETPPLTLYKVIDSLMAAGREQDARALAVEAALVAGL